MANFKVFDGGNLNAQPLNTIKESDYIGGYPVKYSAHLPNRHKVMPFHLDLSDPVWRVWLAQTAGGKLLGADTLGTHLIAAGSEISGVAIEIRSPSSIAGLKIGVKLVLEDGSEVTGLTTDADATGFYWPAAFDRIRVQRAGILYVFFEDGDAEDVASSGLCVSVTPAVIAYDSEYSCHCAPAPCDTTYPDPLCNPYATRRSAPGYEKPTPSTDAVADFTFALGDWVESSFDVTFTNTSTGAVSYSWDFGDSSPASTDENPVHAYSAAGTYTVVLTATDGNGLSATKSVTVEVPAGN